MSPTFFWNRHPRGDLSAHVDGELNPERTTRLEAHLAACDACRAEVAALRVAKAALATLPEATTPRSFGLTPEMAAKPVAAPRYAQPSAPPMAFGLRIASAGLAVALAAVVLVDVNGDGNGSRDSGGDDAALTEIAADADASTHGYEDAAAPNADEGGQRADGDDDFSASFAPTEDLTALATPTLAPAATSTSSEGGAGVGGVGSGPGVGGPNAGAPTGSADGLPETPVPTPTPTARAAAGATAAPTNDVAAAPPEATGENSLLDGFGDTTQEDGADGEALPASGDVDDGGDSGSLLIAEIMLGVGLVLALAASVVVTRLGRRVS